MPATPGLAQLLPRTMAPDGLNAAPVSATGRQARPAWLAARAEALVSVLHPAPPDRESRAWPRRSIAMSCAPSGAPASASGTAARLGPGLPGVQVLPPFAVL